MLLADNSFNVKGTIQSVWDKLVDWSTMHEWDVFLDHLHFDGPLALNSVGKIKTTDGLQGDLVVTQFSPLHSYTDEFSFLGSKLIFHHYVSESSSPGEITVRIAIDGEGILIALLAPLMRKQFAAKMPVLIANFKQQYESAQQNGRSDRGSYNRESSS